MIATENADKVGEFSLTDARLSRISHFMAHTLYDENMGGPYGNTHIAVGLAYRDLAAILHEIADLLLGEKPETRGQDDDEG